MERAADLRAGVRRVLIAGDTHGNTKWVKHLTDAAAQRGGPIIIQVGDFGSFPTIATNRASSRPSTRLARPKAWSCGSSTAITTTTPRSPASRTATSPCVSHEHITYLPLGTRVGLGGCTYGFFGGAFSVDWRYRTAGIDWWQHEGTEPIAL